MAKMIKDKRNFVNKHKDVIDPETRKFIMQPDTRLWREPDRKGVYAAMHAMGLRVFAA